VEVRRRIVHVAPSQRFHRRQVEDGRVDVTGSVKSCYPTFAIFNILDPRDKLKTDGSACHFGLTQFFRTIEGASLSRSPAHAHKSQRPGSAVPVFCVCRWFSTILSPAHIQNHQQLAPQSICCGLVRHLSFSSRSPKQDRCAPPGLGPGLFFFLLLASVYAGLVLRFRRYLSLLPIISPCSLQWNAHSAAFFPDLQSSLEGSLLMVLVE
jgi:hypothetical protein